MEPEISNTNSIAIPCPLIRDSDFPDCGLASPATNKHTPIANKIGKLRFTRCISVTGRLFKSAMLEYRDAGLLLRREKNHTTIKTTGSSANQYQE